MAELTETFKRLELDPQAGSQHLMGILEAFLMPFLLLLDRSLDKRLVRTFLQCLVAIIRLRNNPQALWLSELAVLQKHEEEHQEQSFTVLDVLLHVFATQPYDCCRQEQHFYDLAVRLLARCRA